MALRPDIVDAIRQRFEVSGRQFGKSVAMTATTGEALPPAPPKPFVGVDFARPGGDYTIHTYRNEAKFIALWSHRLRY